MNLIPKLLICFVLTSSCSNLSLEELENEALITGDWSKVERRENRLREKEQWRLAIQHCEEQSKTLYCNYHGGPRDLRLCSCANIAW